MPLQATSGAASYDGFGGGVAVEPVYIEQIFQTYLYTGNGSTQTITNGIDLAGEGGLVWIKERTRSGTEHSLFDTVRGRGSWLSSALTDAAASVPSDKAITSFNSDGFSLGGSYYGTENSNGQAIASWTFRKQPKFFDVVTFSGTGSAQTIAHNLGSVPGCIIVKNLDAATNWAVYHRSLGGTYLTRLNRDWAAETGYENWANTDPTSTVFTVGNGNATNGSGYNYVAYLFAHNAGGFGLTGTDNVISCGSYTGTGATGNAITLGYEPQFVIVKRTDTTADWITMDAMRGGYLKPNTSDAELGGSGWFNVGGDNFFPTATGFQVNTAGAAWNASGGTYIYIAIRRGPMKVPTSGTSVFSPNAVTMTASGSATITTNFPVDLSFNRKRSTADQYVMDRLRGGSQTSYNYLRTQTTGAETTGSTIGVGFDSNTSLVDNNWLSGVSANTIWWSFQRAPSFFDEVCYTGTGSARTVTHNLGVAPEMMIVKVRDSATNWAVYSAAVGNNYYAILNLPDAPYTSSAAWNNTTPTSSVFTVGTNVITNGNGYLYVAYLFASCPGVSKVGSYTGTGTTLQVDCGFTGGARFVLIKRTDSTGDWYVWDSARGIVSGNDPYLLLNSTAAEVTNTDYVDTYSAGFEISSTAPAAINASGGTFIFLAIA